MNRNLPIFAVGSALLMGFPLTAGLAAEPIIVAQASESGPTTYIEDLIQRADNLLNGPEGQRDPETAALLLMEAAKAGNTDAIFTLVDLLTEGDAIEPDPIRAEALIKQAIADGSVAFGNEVLGDFYLKDHSLKSIDDATRAYQAAVDAGSVSAMRRLAELFIEGDVLPADPVRAETLLMQAVAAGDVSGGADALGQLYQMDTPVRDGGKAAAAYQQAIDAGSTGAMTRLADMLVLGEEVPQDLDRAVGLLQQAISAGDIEYGAEALGDFHLMDTRLKDPAKAVESYRMAADAGSTGSLRKLASVLALGDDGVEADPQQAIDLLNQAIEAGDVRFGADSLGQLYLADTPVRDPAAAAVAFEQAAGAGSTAAMTRLADLLISGEGVEQSYPQAEAWLKRAVSTGDIYYGNDALGDFYLLETPLHNAALAAAAYDAAAEVGNTGAMRKLAEMLAAGDEIPAAPEKAEALLIRAIAGGDVGASDDLGRFYMMDTALQDPAKAAVAFERAVETGSTGAMARLAALYVTGNGVPRDPARAEALLQQAVASGDVTWGSDALGDFYLEDTPLRDPALAAAAYEAAAAAGSDSSMRKLAAMLVSGEGVEKDVERAVAMLEQAIAAGDVRQSADALGQLYQTDATLRDPQKAVEAYEAAIEAGSLGAMSRLADMYFNGDGIDPDPAAAEALLMRAVAEGDAYYASEALGDLYLAETTLRAPEKAIRAYERSADAGNPGSLRKLASLFIEGRFVTPNPAMAEQLLLRAIAAGDVRGSADALGQLYQRDTPLKNGPKAMGAYERAIEAGSTGAMIRLANMLATGDGLDADPGRAESLLMRAVDAGDVEYGAEALGELYLLDTPLKDAGKAESNLQAAIDAGNASAMRRLATLLTEGVELTGDVERAEALLKQAIASGDAAGAGRDLGDFYRALETPEGDQAALDAYRLSAAAGNPAAAISAAYLLSEDYRNQDARREAIEMWRAAARRVGVRDVAVEMLGQASDALVMSAQQMLSDQVVPIGVDGVHGGQTRVAITEACRIYELDECQPDLITIDLLMALISDQG